MSAAGHSLGPLKLGRRGLSPAVVDDKGRLIAELPYHSSSTANFVLIDEAIANARLFAAAPELLTAAALALDWMRSNGALLRDMAPIEAAIAAATGQQPDPTR